METKEYSFNYDTNKIKKYKQGLIIIASLFNIPCIVLIFFSLYKQTSDYIAFLILLAIIAFIFNFFTILSMHKIKTKSHLCIFYEDHLLVWPSSKKQAVMPYSYMNRLVYYEMAFQGHIEVKMNLLDKESYHLEDAVFNLAFLSDRDQALFLSLLENIVNGKGAIVSEVYEADWRKQYKSKIKKYDAQVIEDFQLNWKRVLSVAISTLALFLFNFFLTKLDTSGDAHFRSLTYIGLFGYPFARLTLDRLGYFKLKQKLDKQIGLAFGHGIILLFEYVLYFIAFLFLPVTLPFVVVLIVLRIKEKKYNHL